MTRTVLVTASTFEADVFDWATYLGRSISRFPDSSRPELLLAAENVGAYRRGLSEIYNEAIETLESETVAVFVHDDVYIHDWFLQERLNDAMERFDIVGLAGSVNPDLSQPSWGLKFDENLDPNGWQEEVQRSGSVNHFDYAVTRPSWYGPTPLECQLVDGLFIAAKVGTLRDSGTRFDPRFAFHFYDLDFCRNASARGLKIGTWPIAVTHSSGGAFKSQDFKDDARTYIEKWK